MRACARARVCVCMCVCMCVCKLTFQLNSAVTLVHFPYKKFMNKY